MYLLDITYQVVTPESAEHGDFAKTGYEDKGLQFETIAELAQYLRNKGASNLSSSVMGSHDWFIDSGDTDCRTGAETTLCYHPKNLSQAEMSILTRLVVGK